MFSHQSALLIQPTRLRHSPGPSRNICRVNPPLWQVVAPLAANYPSAPTATSAASGPFSWVPRQMLSGDAAEEEGDSDGDSDRGDDDRGEGDEAELVIDIPNE